jgi:hypothetical protein
LKSRLVHAFWKKLFTAAPFTLPRQRRGKVFLWQTALKINYYGEIVVIVSNGS